MPTPAYKGQDQPLPVSGWLGSLGSWFGGGATPAYVGAGQPAPASSGYFGGSTPGYKPAPAAPSSTADSQQYASDPSSATAQPYIGGPIAIVIRRDPSDQ